MDEDESNNNTNNIRSKKKIIGTKTNKTGTASGSAESPLNKTGTASSSAGTPPKNAGTASGSAGTASGSAGTTTNNAGTATNNVGSVTDNAGSMIKNAGRGVRELPFLAPDMGASQHFTMIDNISGNSSLEEIFHQTNEGCDKDFYSRPFTIRYTCLLICVDGGIDVKMNMTPCKLRRGSLLIIRKDTIVEIQHVAADTRLALLAFTREFTFPKHLELPPDAILGAMYNYNVINLTEAELQDALTVFKITKQRIGQSSFTLKRELFIACLNMITFYVSNYFERKQKTDSQIYSAFVSQRFIALVEENFRTNRELSFYAEELCLTPKYMSRLIKEATGKAAKEWIFERVILEAKVMLCQGRYSVQDISDYLGFANQSFFGSFFKKGTGVSPANYRKNL